MSETCTCGLNLNIWQNPWNHAKGCPMQPVMAPSTSDRPGERELSPFAGRMLRDAAAAERVWHASQAPDHPGDQPEERSESVQQQAAEVTYLTWGDWLVLDTGKHNCGVGPDGHYGAHEPGCGLEPVERVSVLLDALAPVLAEREVAARAEEAARWQAKIEALATTFTERRDRASGSEYRRGLADGFDAATEYLRALLDAT